MTAARRVLVTGGGRMARALARRPWPAGLQPVYRTRAQLDLAVDDLDQALAEADVDAVLNTAAWTDVDGAEARREDAWRANVEAPARLADAVQRRGAVLVHLSTDYVFGHGEGPWDEDSPCAPLGVYGQSKRAGELEVLARAPCAFVVRTAWLFDGLSPNFLTAMLALADRQELDVVADQQGSPTFTDDLADGLLALLGRTEALSRDGGGPVLHFANAGQGATRLDMAQAVFEAAFQAAGEPGAASPRLHPVAARDWPSAAERPRDSRLSTRRWSERGLPAPRPWRDAVAAAVRQARDAGEGR